MTTLTVPSAGIDPGRAARSGSVAVDTTGATIAQFGDTMAGVATALQNDRLDREMKRLQVDMTRDLNNLRLQTMQVGDPDQAEAMWTDGIKQLRGSYNQPGENNRPAVDTRNAERFGLAFDDLANRHAFSLGARNLKLRNSQHQASYMAYSHEASQVYATGDEGLRETTREGHDAMVDADIAAGRIDAAEGQRRKMEFRAGGDNARAIQMISEDPRGFQTALDQGEFDGLPEATRARYGAQADRATKALDETAMKAAQKLADERGKAIDGRLDEIRKIGGKGFEAVDEAFLNDPDVKARPDYAETQAVLALRDDGILIEQASPQALRQALDAERGRKVAHAWQTERATALEDAFERHRKGYAADGVGYAQAQGLDVPQLPEFDPADPMAYGAAVSDRVVWARGQRAQGYTDSLRYFSNEERQQLKSLAGSETDPATRASLARTLNVSLSGASPDVVAEFGFDPVFTHVGELQVATSNPALAEEVFRGQQAIQNKNVVLPPVADRLEPTFGRIEAFFADKPDGQALQSRVTASADALYSARMQQQGPADPIEEDVYSQALHEVLGGTGAFDGRDATGGVQEYNDALTMMPVGVGRRQIDNAVMNLRRDLQGISQPVSRRAFDNAVDIAASGGLTVRPLTKLSPAEVRARADATLQSVSLTGGHPGVNGEPLTADDLADAQLINAGNGQYALSIDGVTVMDLQNNGLWRFDLERLVSEYNR